MKAVATAKWGLLAVTILVTVFLVLVPIFHLSDRWISAFSAIGTVWAAAAAAWAITAIREDRIDRDQPRVVVWMRVSFKQTLWLEVENRGNSIAHDVRFHFNPVPRAPDHKAVDEVPAFRDGIPSLLPGERLLPFILWFGARLDELSDKVFDLTVTYTDSRGHASTFQRHFDLDRIRDLQLTTRTIEESLADSQSGLLVKVDALNRELGKMNDNLSVIAAGIARDDAGDSHLP